MISGARYSGVPHNVHVLHQMQKKGNTYTQKNKNKLRKKDIEKIFFFLFLVYVKHQNDLFTN